MDGLEAPYVCDLPLELWQLVLAGLARADIKAARLVCAMLGRLGFELLFEKITICYTREHFIKLRNIAQTPRIARCVRHLCFNQSIFVLPSGASYHRWHFNCVRGTLDPDLWQGHVQFERFKEICADQQRVRAEKLDIECATEFFKAVKGCTSLTITTVSNDRREGQDLRFMTELFGDMPNVAGLRRYIRNDQQSEVIRDVLTCAATHLQHALTALHLPGVALYEYRAFVQKRPPKQVSQLMGALRKLTIQMMVPFGYQTASQRNSGAGSVAGKFTPAFRKFLHMASQTCVVLHIDFGYVSHDDLRGRSSEYDFRHIRPCKKIFLGTSLPKLKHLTVGDAPVDEGFALFLLRSRELETLELSLYPYLQASPLYRRIAGKLPKLLTVNIHGPLFDPQNEKQWPGLSGAAWTKVLKSDIESFIIHGGICPDLNKARDLLILAQHQAEWLRPAADTVQSRAAVGFGAELDRGDAEARVRVVFEEDWGEPSGPDVVRGFRSEA